MSVVAFENVSKTFSRHAGQVLLSFNLYLFGEDAAAVRERDEPLWRAWMEARFPAPSPVEEAPAT